MILVVTGRSLQSEDLGATFFSLQTSKVWTREDAGEESDREKNQARRR